MSRAPHEASDRDRAEDLISRPASWWGRRAPETKQKLVMISIAGGLLVMMAILVMLDSGGGVRHAAPPASITKNLLTDADPRALGIEGLGQQIRTMREQNARLQTMVDGFAEKQRLLRVEGFQVLDRRQIEQKQKIERLRTEITQLHDELVGARAESQSPKEPSTFTPEPVPGPTTVPPPKPAKQQADRLDIGALFGSPAKPAPPPVAAVSAPLKIRTVTESSLQTGAARSASSATPSPPGASASGGKGASGQEHVFIPAGSILKGVLITGMDAPTGKQARRDPYPTLIRVKREAILPNRFRADVRECFVVAAGYGSLSSERALIRGESISCVRNDGGVIEAGIDGYAVGEDGKVGMRGRLVSKQGQVLARAMAAGFAKGFGNVFSQQSVPVLSTAPTGASPFNQVLSPEALQSGVVSGAGDAFDRLANFYISMAEEMFPVIEVDAGRGVEFILNHGVDLRLRAS